MRTIVHLRGLVVAAMMVAACLGNDTSASEPFDLRDDGWHTWRTEAIESSGERCCFRWTGTGARKRACDLDRSHGNYGSVDGFPNYSGEVQIYVLMESGAPEKITVLSPQCEVSTATEIDDHGVLDSGESVDWLRQFVRRDSDLTSEALAAISQHGGDRSLAALIAVVESGSDRDVRQEAIFWLVQSGSDAAFEYVDRLLTGS